MANMTKAPGVVSLEPRRAVLSGRVTRCRVTDRLHNPCPNPSLTEFGLCMRHLKEAAEEWARVVAEASGAGAD